MTVCCWHKDGQGGFKGQNPEVDLHIHRQCCLTDMDDNSVGNE